MLSILRQFGLQYCELPNMIENIAIFLRCLTVNIDSRYKEGIPIFYYVITLFTVVSYFYIYLFSMVWFVFIRCPETGDLVGAMVILSLSICNEVSVIKLAFMAFYSDELRGIVDQFLECDARVIPGSRFCNNIMNTLRKVKLRAVVYWLTMMINALLYNCTPIFRSGRHLSEDFLTIYGLEPMFESPNFEITTVLTTIIVFFVCYSVANTSGFIIILVGYIEANLLSLSEEVKEVWNDAVADKREDTAYKDLKNQPLKIVNIYLKNRLVRIINIHKANINLMSSIEHLFRIPIAAGFLCESVSIIAQLLGGLKYTYLELPFALVQISMDCYVGQKVMDASLKFEEAVYDCKWEKFDNTNKKLVLMMLQNSQRTMTLSAGGMVTMSFSTLMSVLRSIHSTYTTLRSRLYKKQ